MGSFSYILPLTTSSTTKTSMGATQKFIFKVLLRPIAKKQKATWKPAFPAQEWCHFAATETYSRGTEILPPIIQRVNYTGKYCNGLAVPRQTAHVHHFLLNYQLVCIAICKNERIPCAASFYSCTSISGTGCSCSRRKPWLSLFPLHVGTIFLLSFCTSAQGNALSLLRCAHNSLN